MTAGARYRDAALLQRLPQRFQCIPAELGDLIQEEDAAVGTGDLAGPGRGAAATDEGGGRDGVMRRPKRGDLEQASAGWKGSDARSNRRHLDGLSVGQRRKNARKGAGQQRLACARGTNQ